VAFYAAPNGNVNPQADAEWSESHAAATAIPLLPREPLATQRTYRSGQLHRMRRAGLRAKNLFARAGCRWLRIEIAKPGIRLQAGIVIGACRTRSRSAFPPAWFPLPPQPGPASPAASAPAHLPLSGGG